MKLKYAIKKIGYNKCTIYFSYNDKLLKIEELAKWKSDYIEDLDKEDISIVENLIMYINDNAWFNNSNYTFKVKDIIKVLLYYNRDIYFFSTVESIKFIDKYKYKIYDINTLKLYIEKKEDLYKITNYRDYKNITDDVIVIENNHSNTIFYHNDASRLVYNLKSIMNRNLFINFINSVYIKNKDMFVFSEELKNEINYIEDKIKVKIEIDKYMEIMTLKVNLNIDKNKINIYTKLTKLYSLLKPFMPYYLLQEINLFDMNINIHNESIYRLLNTLSDELDELIDANIDIKSILIKDLKTFLNPKIEYNKETDDFTLHLNKEALKVIKKILVYNEKYFPKTIICKDHVVKVTRKEYKEIKLFCNTLFVNANTLKEENRISKALIYNIFNSDSEYMEYIDKKELKPIYEEIINYNPLDVKIPNNLNVVLRDYQKYGFRYLKMLDKYGFGGILADEMGLRKNSSSNNIYTKLR